MNISRKMCQEKNGHSERSERVEPDFYQGIPRTPGFYLNRANNKPVRGRLPLAIRKQQPFEANTLITSPKKSNGRC